MNIRWLFTLMITALFFTACDEGDPIDYIEPDEGREYFPLQSGQSWTYLMDSMLYDLEGGDEVVIDSTQSFLRYEILTEELQADGSLLVEVRREYRPSDSVAWRYFDNMEYRLSETEFQSKEGNVRLLHASFPLTESRSWDPTRYTDENVEIKIKGEPVQMFKYWEGSVTNMDSTGSVLGQQDVSLLKTSMSDFTSLIELRRVEEIYAEDIGLVSRELWILDTQCEQLGGDPIACDGMHWDEIANRGFILRQELIAYE